MTIDNVKEVKQTANNTTGKVQTKQKASGSRNVNSVFTDSTAIAASIKKDVSAKNRYGLPTTGKDLGKHVRQITTENSFDVYQNYKSRNGETIMSAILAERGLDINERTEYCRHIWNAMLRNAKQQGVNVNDLDKQFMTELYKQKNSILPANATKINKLVTQMINRCNGTESSPKTASAETAKTAKTSAAAAKGSGNKTITETDSVKQSKQIVSELDTAHKKFKQVDGSGYKKPDTIASALKSDIYGLGTLKNFVKHIKDITSANVWKVTSSYRNKTGNNLFQDIMSEHGLDINTRLECCRHVWNAMLRDMKAEGVYTKDLDTAFMAELKKTKRFCSARKRK